MRRAEKIRIRLPGDEREIEEKYRSLFEQSRDAVYITTREGRFIDANQSALELFGYTKEEMLSLDVREAYANPGEREEFQREVERWGSVKDFEVKLCRKDGSLIDCLLTSAVMRGADGAILGYQGIIHDISSRKQMEDRLRESEEKLRIMFESIVEGVIVYGLDGCVTQANNAAVNLFGFNSKEELLGSAAIALIAAKDQLRAVNTSRSILKTRHTRSGEFICVRRDGTQFEAELSIAPMKDKDGSPTGVVVVIRDITERKRLSEGMEYYIGEITRAQEEERRRIARELHDGIVQSLVSLALDIESANKDEARLPPETSQQLQQLWNKTQDIMKELRHFSYELRPDIIDRLGLAPALESLTAELNREQKIDARLEIEGSERRLPPEAELVLFRVAQEALRNIRKHSQATEVIARIEFSAESVKLSIIDNGRGFELPGVLCELASKGKLGLIGMQERARLLGGDFTVDSRPGGGTMVSLEVKA